MRVKMAVAFPKAGDGVHGRDGRGLHENEFHVLGPFWHPPLIDTQKF